MNALLIRRVAPPLYSAAIICSLLFTNTSVFLVITVFGAMLVGLVFVVAKPQDGPRSERRREQRSNRRN